MTKGNLGSLSTRTFSKKAKLPCRRHCAWICEVSGYEAVAEFCIQRLEQGLINEDSPRRALVLIINQCHLAMEKELGDFLTLFTPFRGKVRSQIKKDMESNWEKQRALITQRESQRRADLLAERQRITSNLKVYCECDQSIGRKLDILIAQIKATDFAGLKERSV